MKKIVLILSILLLSFAGFAQKAPADSAVWIVYDSLNSPMGCSTIRALAIDPYNVKWISNWAYGVYRFDGTTWVNYNSSNSGLSYNYVTSIAVDSISDKWFGTYFKGLNEFDDSTWTVYTPQNSAIPDSSIICVAADDLGYVWAGTEAGLVRSNGNGTWQVFNTSNSGLPDQHVEDITFDFYGNKWIATYGGIARFTGLSWTVYNTGNSGLVSNTTSCIEADPSGTIWVGTWSGLSRFDGTTWTTYTHSNSGLPSNDITSVRAQNSDMIWIGSLGGLTLFEPGSGTWTTYNTSNSGIPSNNVDCIALDSYNNKWIGTYEGGLAEFTMQAPGAELVVIGMITDSVTGLPINDQQVFIVSDSAGSGFSYSNTVFTNSSGIYSDTLYIPTGVTAGNIVISVVDCHYDTLSATLPFDLTNLVLQQNFQICTLSVPCEASFTYSVSSSNQNLVNFLDQSTGQVESWLWNFGDSASGPNNISTIENPSHIFTDTGTYTVCLTISGGGCSSTWCATVTLYDSSQYNSVYGQVFAGYFPISTGMALLFSVDTSLNYTPYIDASVIDSNGTYYFTLVPDGNYYVLAIPFDSTGYLPTYYGDEILWEDATVIALGEPANPYDIHLVQAQLLTPGNGSIGGQISNGGSKEVPLNYIMMLLQDESGNTISFNQLTDDGVFGFPELGYGTYYLHAEIAGVTSDYIRVEITAEHPDTLLQMTFSGNNILGIGGAEPSFEAGQAYPNPVRDILNIVICPTRSTRITAELYSITGSKVYSASREVAAGRTTLSIPVTQLQPGIYTLKLWSPEGIRVDRKILRMQ